MLDKWLNDDINNLFNNGSTIVLIDESGEMKNILTKLNLNCRIYEVNSPLEELKALTNKFMYVIDNNQGLDELHQKLDLLIQKILED